MQQMHCSLFVPFHWNDYTRSWTTFGKSMAQRRSRTERWSEFVAWGNVCVVGFILAFGLGMAANRYENLRTVIVREGLHTYPEKILLRLMKKQTCKMTLDT